MYKPLNRAAACLEPQLYLDKTIDLVERCRAGERKAQYDLYRQYSKAMYNVCLRIVGHEAEAEDVLQDAFLDAFTHLGSFRGQSTFGAWLKQITVNRAIGHLRSRKLDLVSTDGQRIGEDDSIDIADAEPVDEAGIAWEVERVRRAVQTLPEGYRVVLSLYLFEGYDHEEISNVLNISEVTSRSQYMRAKKKVLELLR